MINDKNINAIGISQTSRRRIILVGVFTTLIAIFGLIADIFIGSSLGGDLTAVPQTASEMFGLFHRNWLLGLYNLDMLNQIVAILMIPSFCALYIAHEHTESYEVKFAFIVFVIATAIFITNNSALPMFDLSRKFFSTNDTMQQLSYSAAGEAMLARGAHGSAGAFAGFALSSIASILMSIGMYRGKVFGKITSLFGIIGGTLLLIYLVLVTFVPNVRSYVMLISAPGGILSLTWMILYTIKLYRLVNQKPSRGTKM